MSKRERRQAVGASWQQNETNTGLSLEQLQRDGYNMPFADLPSGKALKVRQDENGNLTVGNFRLTSTGLDVTGENSQEDWQTVGDIIFRVNRSVQWLIGDWLAYGEQFQWGRTYEEFAAEYGYTIETLRQYVYVARNVDLSIRIDKLSFAHHQLIAALPADQQAALLVAAAESGWSVARLRAEISDAQLQAKLPRYMRLQQSTDKAYAQVAKAARTAKGAARQEYRQLVMQQIVQWQSLLADLDE